MIKELKNILDGLQDSGVEASDLRDKEVSVGYEGQEWSAEVRIDDVKYLGDEPRGFAVFVHTIQKRMNECRRI